MHSHLNQLENLESSRTKASYSIKNAVRVSFVPIPDEDRGYPVETSCNNKTHWITRACGIIIEVFELFNN